TWRYYKQFCLFMQEVLNNFVYLFVHTFRRFILGAAAPISAALPSVHKRLACYFAHSECVVTGVNRSGFTDFNLGPTGVSSSIVTRAGVILRTMAYVAWSWPAGR